MECPKCGKELKEYVFSFLCRNAVCKYRYMKKFPSHSSMHRELQGMLYDHRRKGGCADDCFCRKVDRLLKSYEKGVVLDGVKA